MAMEIEKTKVCTKCGKKKPLSEFHKDKSRIDGRKCRCKMCIKNYSKDYYKSNKKERSEKSLNYYIVNRDRIIVRMKKYRIANRERLLACMKKYYISHKAKILAYSKKYGATNGERRRDRRKKRYHENMMFRLNDNVSGAIYKALKEMKNGKHWEDLVGYTLNELKAHLEKLFTDGMSWDNHSKDGWEIDHKIPISVFNFTKPEHRDFKRCWALSNLQPMWAVDNNKKRAKLIKHFQPSLEL